MARAPFDSLIRSFAATRRFAVRVGLGGTVAGIVGLSAREEVAARCRDSGRRCRRGTLCCSGVCRGRRRKRCRPAFSQGICTREEDACTEASAVECGTAPGACHCLVLPGGASFCADRFRFCAPCTSDAQCETEVGAGARCIACAICPVGTSCVAPCPGPAEG